MKQRILIFWFLLFVVVGQLKGQSSTNTIRYQITYETVNQLYTVWIIPGYNTPNTFNADTAERGPTAQVTLRVPKSFLISEVIGVKGEWDKTPLRLGPNEPNQSFFNSLSDAYRYYVIGKAATETIYGRFTKDKAVALFQFKGNGCFGAISVLDESDEFVKLAEKYALNVRPSFYSRSGQRNFVNAVPLEQFADPLDPPAYCCGSGVTLNSAITINTNQSSFCPGATASLSLKGMSGVSNQAVRFRQTTTEPLTEEEAYASSGTLLGVVPNSALTSNKTEAVLTNIVLPKNAGKYFIVATLDGVSGACRPYSSTRFTIATLANAAISSDKTGTICLGESVLLTAQPAGQTKYEWLKDGQSVGVTSTNTYRVTSAGEYKVTITNELGCNLGASNATTFTTIVVNKPTIKQVGERLVSSSKTGNQWFYNNAAIPNATDTVYLATKQGVYTLQITLGNCKSELSDPVLFAITSVQEPLNANEYRLYPNPTTGFFTIESDSVEYDELACYDFTGKKIEINVEKDAEKLRGDIRHLPKGLYILKLTNESKNAKSWVVRKE
ncbi:T9SS type A sorting domain-containing protein [Runella limosa]|uniref:T9SS type A sorting domain-containing protein n=1 Tax=Runella limosa TaxID=370978 RepID=UPI00042714CD|nr:T9SS type A sorting domain-containing protein [Runella limosa]